MTALALAGAGQGGVAPDLVLPPGFGRIGEAVRFEQDSGPGADRAGRVPGSPIVSSNGAPAAAGQRPALSLDDQEDGNCRSVRALRPEDRIPCTRCHLRGHVAGDPDRCLYYRGSLGLGGAAAQAQLGG